MSSESSGGVLHTFSIFLTSNTPLTSSCLSDEWDSTVEKRNRIRRELPPSPSTFYQASGFWNHRLSFFLFQWVDYPCSVSDLPSSVTGLHQFLPPWITFSSWFLELSLFSSMSVLSLPVRLTSSWRPPNSGMSQSSVWNLFCHPFSLF